MTNNEVIVSSGNFNNCDIGCAFAANDVELMNVSSNAVTITGGINIKNVCGGRTINGTATLNTVTLTDGVTVGRYVCEARIGNGYASSNTVTITGGNIQGSVFGGYVSGNGQAINNKITITGTPEFSGATILCGGVASVDAFTGNTLRIEIEKTKGIVVNGISNFEDYEFHLKGIKSWDIILTATNGGCGWYKDKDGGGQYTGSCTVDLSSSNIQLYTEGVINKGDYLLYIDTKSARI